MGGMIRVNDLVEPSYLVSLARRFGEER